MANKIFTPGKALFFSSILLPYPLDLTTNDTGVLLWDFISLIILATSSLILSFGTRELRSNGKGLIYLAITPRFLILYFYSFDYRMKLQKIIYFYTHKSEMEYNIAQLNNKQLATDSLNFSHHSLPAEHPWYDKFSSGIILCTTEGQSSVYFAGYAYSPQDKQLTKRELAGFNGEFYEWHKVADHWYRWARRDG